MKKIAIKHIDKFSIIVRFDKGTLNDVPKQAQLIISSFLLNFIKIPYVWGIKMIRVKTLENRYKNSMMDKTTKFEYLEHAISINDDDYVDPKLIVKIKKTYGKKDNKKSEFVFEEVYL